MGVIAELCQNHNGDLSLLKDMVFHAKDAGAEFAKIQTFFADDLTENWKWDYERLKQLELNWDGHEKFMGWCKEADIKPMTSVYSFKYAESLNQLGFQYINIGSAQCMDEDLISRYSLAGFKMFLSTGGGWNLAKIHRLIGPTQCVMHCVSQYPSHPYEANLLRMLEIPKYWGHTPYGFSDHTDPDSFDWDVPAKTAIALGAQYIEKHFTLLRKNETKDGKVSINKEQLKSICDFWANPWEKEPYFMKWFGLFKKEASAQEKELIEKYQGRWKQDEPGTGIEVS